MTIGALFAIWSLQLSRGDLRLVLMQDYSVGRQDGDMDAVEVASTTPSAIGRDAKGRERGCHLGCYSTGT